MCHPYEGEEFRADTRKDGLYSISSRGDSRFTKMPVLGTLQAMAEEETELPPQPDDTDDTL